MVRIILPLAGAALGLAAAGQAHAALIPVASLQNPTAVTFPGQGPLPPGPATSNGVTISDPGATFDVDVAGGTSSFPSGTPVIYDGGFAGTTGTGTVRLSFGTPVTGFSFGVEDFDTFTAPITYTVTAFDGSGAVLGTQSANGAFGDVLATFTDTATAPIGSLAISDNDLSSGGIGLGLIRIQAPTAVPEPATLFLLGASLAGGAGLRRRWAMRHRTARV